MKATVRKGFHHLGTEKEALTSNYSKGVKRLFFTIEIEGTEKETSIFDRSRFNQFIIDLLEIAMKKEINETTKTKPNELN